MDLNETFTRNARLYNEMRPKYDRSILDNIKKYVKLDETSEILEIGCGTGQATELFIPTKAKIHCIDIGKELIKICNHKYSKYDNIEFEVFQYEEYQSQLKFDLVFSATAYHWVKQPASDKKTYEILKDDGVFALFRNYHINKNSYFYEDSQSIYEEYMGKKRNIESINYGIMNKELFSIVCDYEYYWDSYYSTEDYISLLSTYSDHIALEPDKRYYLFEKLSELINNKYHGKVHKEYLTKLEIGKKR